MESWYELVNGAIEVLAVQGNANHTENEDNLQTLFFLCKNIRILEKNKAQCLSFHTEDQRTQINLNEKEEPILHILLSPHGNLSFSFHEGSMKKDLRSLGSSDLIVFSSQIVLNYCSIYIQLSFNYFDPFSGLDYYNDKTLFNKINKLLSG